MHHLKETTIDGVGFVLIPVAVYEELVEFIHKKRIYTSVNQIALKWEAYDPEVFKDVE